jgi:hypothetical protein
LAGFSFALVGLVLPSPENFRWPNAALACLLAGGVAFIAAVQCWFWARQYAITPDDIKRWNPNYPEGRKRALQRLHNVGFYKWNGRLLLSYRAGISLLLVGMTFALVPPGEVGWLRGVTIGIAALATLGELWWIFATWLLYGSPDMAYEDQPDIPRDDVRMRWLRSWRPLRRLARPFVPLPRIHRTADELLADRSHIERTAEERPTCRLLPRIRWPSKPS